MARSIFPRGPARRQPHRTAPPVVASEASSGVPFLPRQGVPAPSSDAVDVPAIPLARDGHACDGYGPGHLMHYEHQARASHATSVEIRGAVVEGSSVRLELAGGASLEWRHHDPERLARLLELVLGGCVAVPDHHALRVGPYWFNCARERDLWQDCRPAHVRR